MVYRLWVANATYNVVGADDGLIGTKLFSILIDVDV